MLASQGADVGAGFPGDGLVEAVADEGFAVGEGVTGDGLVVGSEEADADLAVFGGFVIER